MTQATATATARRILRNGHFADGADAIVIHEGRRLRLYATAGRLSHGEMVRQLAQALSDLDRYGDCCCEEPAR